MGTNNTKMIKISIKDSNELLYKTISFHARGLGKDIKTVAGTIIDEALKNKSRYDDALSHPFPESEGKEIVISVSAENKNKFKEWAKISERTQSKHAAFILEKWLELKKISIK